MDLVLSGALSLDDLQRLHAGGTALRIDAGSRERIRASAAGRAARRRRRRSAGLRRQHRLRQARAARGIGGADLAHAAART